MVSRGYRPVGKDFPVFLHPETQAEYALARTERKTGKGYKGFMFYADPTVTLEQDLERRDLTINAMAQEVDADGKWVGPILDPYNGQQDLAARIFRHVSDAFAEDPLRLLRIARFAARLPEFIVAPETMNALQAIVRSNELSSLSSGRIWQELSRGFTASKPMRMFQVFLDADAARVLLPSKLVSNLANEEYREQFAAYLNAAGNRLEDCCAVTCMYLSASEIRLWAESVKMPNEVRDFSEIFSELTLLMKKALGELGSVYQPVDVLAWFNRADVWRKPDRGYALLDLAKRIGLNVDILILAMQNVQALNAAEVITSIPAEDRSNGENIRSAVDAARLLAIATSLNS
jgi:tRNA nucleotidyltransferase (CCA-adding enzyme)